MPYFDRINVSEGNKFTIQISEIEVLSFKKMSAIDVMIY